MGSRESSLPILPLADMADRHPGLTPAVAEAYLEAARVCLDRHHSSPAPFTIKGEKSRVQALAQWAGADDRVRAAWGNQNDTTEVGAYACAIAAVELTEGLVAIRRAETRTGADYYVAPQEMGRIDDLETSLRLEVSGTDSGSPSALECLLREKLEQASRGASSLPAMAGVVGFRALLILTERVKGDDLG